ncbi:glycosyltransferase [Curtobacterium sp. 9128]|uniref:glycosyltransferase family 2 protein n=1 Tax=Curtobacterium sp. 9128 TaxID=1793722 RepID=UPI0011A5C4F7|nr:glycosyltransferase [Curtobacterium sp. 9128]
MTPISASGATESPIVDVLMISHKRADYFRRSLESLLEAAKGDVRVWLWHNGSDPTTQQVFDQYRDDPRVFRSHHSEFNAGLRGPTNWVWAEGEGQYVSKVDDDCVEDQGWLDRLLRAHQAEELGAIAAWRFYPEDFLGARSLARVARYQSGVRIMRSNWVQGSGYLLPRRTIDRFGLLGDHESFPDWCVRSSRGGAQHGWLFPFIHEEHMDDPRSPLTMFTDDATFVENRPLHARLRDVRTLGAWEEEQREAARIVQAAGLAWYGYESPMRRRVQQLRALPSRAKHVLKRSR